MQIDATVKGLKVPAAQAVQAAAPYEESVAAGQAMLFVVFFS